MQSKLIAHKNKAITISISNFEIHFEIENNGQLKTIDKKKKIDCIIKLSIKINYSDPNKLIVSLRIFFSLYYLLLVAKPFVRKFLEPFHYNTNLLFFYL